MRRLFKITVSIMGSLFLLGCPGSSQSPYYYRGLRDLSSNPWGQYTMSKSDSTAIQIRTGIVTTYAGMKQQGVFAEIINQSKTLNLDSVRVASTQYGVLHRNDRQIADSSRSRYFYARIMKEHRKRKRGDSILIHLPSGKRLIFSKKKNRKE